MSSDLNCDESERRTLLEAINSICKSSQKYLLESPSLLNYNSSSFSDVKDFPPNVPCSVNGVVVPYASANSDDNAFQTNDNGTLKSPQNTFTVNEYNDKELFNIGDCSSPGTQSHSSETEIPRTKNYNKEEYDENQASDSATVSRTSHLLQTLKTKDCMLSFVEKGRTVINGQINLARRAIKKKNHGYICESSSVEMLYSQNKGIHRKDKTGVNQVLHINSMETYSRTPSASSTENLNNDSFENREENNFIPNRQSSTSAYSRSSEEVLNGCSEFDTEYRMTGNSEDENFHNSTADTSFQFQGSIDTAVKPLEQSTETDERNKDYRMIGSSEDENFHFHSSTTDTSCQSQGSMDTSLKQLQHPTETDESNEESLVTVNYYDPEEEGTNSVSVNDNEQKMEWEFKNLKTSTSNKVQSEETLDNISERRKSIDYTDSKQGCSSYGNKQDNVTAWKSSLGMDEHFEFHEDSVSPEMLNNREERNNSFSDEKQDVKPLRYNLKYENLDLSILDSSPCITIKLICEKEVENRKPARNQLRQVRTSEHRLSSKYEILLTPEESALGSSSEVPYAEISKLNLTVTAGHEGASETSTPQPGLDERTISRKDSQDSRFDEVTEACNTSETASGINESGLKDDVNSSVMETENPIGHLTDEIEDKEIASEEKRELDSHVTENNLDDSESNNHQQYVENVLEIPSDAISVHDKNDFNFETDNLKLNYKPTPHSGSIDVSFRQTRNRKKFVFKTEEKKLYVKMTPPD